LANAAQQRRRRPAAHTKTTMPARAAPQRVCVRWHLAHRPRNGSTTATRCCSRFFHLPATYNTHTFIFELVSTSRITKIASWFQNVKVRLTCFEAAVKLTLVLLSWFQAFLSRQQFPQHCDCFSVVAIVTFLVYQLAVHGPLTSGQLSESGHGDQQCNDMTEVLHFGCAHNVALLSLEGSADKRAI